MPGQTINTAFSTITPAGFRSLVERAGFSNTPDLAKFMGVKDSTARDWVAGKKDIPKAVVMALGLMSHFNVSPLVVQAITGEGNAL